VRPPDEDWGDNIPGFVQGRTTTAHLPLHQGWAGDISGMEDPTNKDYSTSSPGLDEWGDNIPGFVRGRTTTAHLPLQQTAWERDISDMEDPTNKGYSTSSPGLDKSWGDNLAGFVRGRTTTAHLPLQHDWRGDRSMDTQPIMGYSAEPTSAPEDVWRGDLSDFAEGQLATQHEEIGLQIG